MSTAPLLPPQRPRRQPPTLPLGRPMELPMGLPAHFPPRTRPAPNVRWLDRTPRVPALAAPILGLALMLSGCAQILAGPSHVDVVEPTTARPNIPEAPPPATLATGAIYRPDAFRPLFEDRRARLVGDILTVVLQEKTTAKQSSSSSLDRTSALEAGVTALPLLSAGRLNKLNAKAQSANSMAGKGDSASDNIFTGSIAVTVVDVLSNGNLVVSGEKQIGINQNADRLRFSGVVNPATILAGNSVSSTQIADARLQVRGTGDIDRAQTTGWLSRFFLSWWPL